MLKGGGGDLRFEEVEEENNLSSYKNYILIIKFHYHQTMGGS